MVEESAEGIQIICELGDPTKLIAVAKTVNGKTL
jgi:hypothetical protein